MAQPRAVIDIVMAKALTDQLLKQIGLLIGAFGTTETRNGLPAFVGFQIEQPFGCKIQRLVP